MQVISALGAAALAAAALAALSQHKAYGRNCQRLVAVVASAPELRWNGFREFMEFDAENLLQESKSEILRYAGIFAYFVSVRRWDGFALIADLGFLCIPNHENGLDISI